MLDRKFVKASRRISAVHIHVKTVRNCVLPHLRWELRQVMSRVRPEDLSAPEITALLGVLTPAHSRVIGGPASRPPIGLGVGDKHPTPNLA
jgi:hypothetical protein